MPFALPRIEDPGRIIRGVALFCALLALSSLTLAALTQDDTVDEVYHLDYALRIVTDAPLTRTGLSNSKTPALVPAAWAEILARRLGSPTPKALQVVTRLTTALYFVALLVAVFFFARRFAGVDAGWIAVLCCSLEPNLVAHASLNTVDVAFALANLLALWAMLAFARRADWRTSIALGAALGLAFTVKFTGLFLVPAVLSLPFWKKDGAWPARAEWLRRAGWLALALLLSMLAISASYYFRDVGKPLAEHAFVTQPMRLLASWLGWLRLPLPEQYLLGADTLAAHKPEEFRVLLFDREYERGVWYYFVALWFFKTPLALMAACLAGAWLGWRCGAFRQPGAALLVFQSALYLAYFSFFFYAQLGYRFVLMILPVAFVLLAVAMKDWWSRQRGAYAALAVAALALAELAPYYGHALAFSNSFLLPKKDAYRVLADSNLYWNEYHTQLGALLRQNGVKAAVNPAHILPGGNAIDSLELSGVVWPAHRHKWVRENLETSGHVKHVLFLYDVTQRDFDRFLDQNRRFPASGAAANCSGERYRALQVEQQRSGVMPLCVEATELADVSLTALRGRTAAVAHGNREGRCADTDYAPVEAGQELWFRLEPGRHLLCVANQDQQASRWEVRRGTASFQVMGAR